MKPVAFLFLLAALIVSLASQTNAVDLKKGSVIASAPGPGEFAVNVSLLGEKGTVFRSGDEIRLSFQTTKDAYVVLYDVDVDGNVQLLYPEDGRLVLSEGRKAYFLPPPGKGVIWTAGRTTGVEYIHAVAVTDPARINADELNFLARNGSVSSEKQFRVDLDPYLAFNMIDEQLVYGAEKDAPATDFTYFYVNRHVEYPRYLCSKCHSPEKLPDPYAMECPEIVIEKISYEEEPHYPYPPLYDVKHVVDKTKEDTTYSSGRYSDKWVNSPADTNNENNNGDATHLYLTVDYAGHPFWGGWGPTLIAFDPFYWDPFWWDFNWGFNWGNCYWWPSYGWWYPPSYYWGYHYRYPWWGPYWNDGGYCGWYGEGHGRNWRPIYGGHNAVKRPLDYARTNTDIRRGRDIAGSRLVRSENRDVARRLERSTLQRRAVEGSVGRTVVMGGRTAVVGRAGVVRNRELTRTVIYGNGGERRASSRAANRDLRTRTRGPVSGRLPSVDQGDARSVERSRGESPRARSGEGGRDVIRHADPGRRSSDSGRGESTGGRSGNVDRSGSRGRGRASSDLSMNGYYGRSSSRGWSSAPARGYGGASASRAAAPAGAGARTSGASASTGRSRSR
ncbi:MAG: DUF4384 domain-containing protein [Candidatus Krumholzibacteriaceae bacterium]|jgi:hypothetical protein